MSMKWKLTPQFRLVLILASLFLLFTGVIGLHRHFTFYSSYDQGIFNQVFWNGIHGRFFQSSLSSQLSTNTVHSQELPFVGYHRLGQHFTPALLLWHPLYALFPHPATLTVLQVTLITAAGLVLYVLAREYVQPKVGLIITGSFYTANAVLGPTLANFHDISQTPLLVFTILLAMERRWWWLFWLLAVILLAVREDSGIVLFSIGFYLLVSRRFPWVGLGVCVLSFGYMLVLTNLIMPLFSDDISKRFMLERFGQYVEGSEASTLDVIKAMLMQPGLILQELFSPPGRTISYLLGQWLPLAFIPAISPAAWLVAGFPLLKLLLGKGFSVLAINIRYALTVVPGLFYGTILWWGGQNWRNWYKNPAEWQPRELNKPWQGFWLFCLGLSLCFTITSNPNRSLYFLIPDSVEPWVHIPITQQWQHASQIYPLLRQIPPDASVSATTYIIPHLSGRREIIRLPQIRLRNDRQTAIKVDYLIADLWQLQKYQVAFSDDRAILADIVSLIQEVTEDGEYGVIGFNQGVILLQRDVQDNPEAKQSWQEYVTYL